MKRRLQSRFRQRFGPLNYLDFRRKGGICAQHRAAVGDLRGESPLLAWATRWRWRAGGGTIVPRSRHARIPDDVPEVLLQQPPCRSPDRCRRFCCPQRHHHRARVHERNRALPFIPWESVELSFFDPSRAGSTLKEVVESAPVERVPVVDRRSDFDRWRWVVELQRDARWHLGPSGFALIEIGAVTICPLRSSVFEGSLGTYDGVPNVQRWLVRAPDEGKGGSWIHHPRNSAFC